MQYTACFSAWYFGFRVHFRPQDTANNILLTA